MTSDDGWWWPTTDLTDVTYRSRTNKLLNGEEREDVLSQSLKVLPPRCRLSLLSFRNSSPLDVYSESLHHLYVVEIYRSVGRSVAVTRCIQRQYRPIGRSVGRSVAVRRCVQRQYQSIGRSVVLVDKITSVLLSKYIVTAVIHRSQILEQQRQSQWQQQQQQHQEPRGSGSSSGKSSSSSTSSRLRKTSSMQSELASMLLLRQQPSDMYYSNPSR